MTTAEAMAAAESGSMPPAFLASTADWRTPSRASSRAYSLHTLSAPMRCSAPGGSNWPRRMRMRKRRRSTTFMSSSVMFPVESALGALAVMKPPQSTSVPAARISGTACSGVGV